MSSDAPTKRLQAPNTLPGKGLADWLLPLVTSTVGMKVIVAVTGLGLVGFVVGHMVGHLKMFAGQEDYNKYAAFLKSLGPLLWIARGGLLAMFALHVICTIQLVKRSRAARPVPYHFHQTIQASVASRMMMYAGLMMLGFVVFHLAHFTLGAVKGAPAEDPITHKTVWTNYLDLRDKAGHVDVYAMMIDGFQNPFISVLYLFALFMLYLHLSHGISSLFQTLGLNTPRTQGFLKIAGRLAAAVICLGYSAVIIAVWTGLLPAVKTYAAG